METTKTPTNLLEAIRFFADLDVATDFAAKLRWPTGPSCPSCGSKRHGYLKSRRLWRCKDCRKQYSVKLGTFMEDSSLGLDKWMAGMWMVANCKNGVSSHEMARSLGITQKSAWFLLHRIRTAMQRKSMAKLSGHVEADESYVGGKGINMHKAKKAKYDGKRGIAMNKTAVMGMRERDGKVIAHVVPNTKRPTIHEAIHTHVEKGSTVYSDKLLSYLGLEGDYDHKVIDHMVAYVEGKIHTNGIENFWALLKRSLNGTYVAVRREHLDAYVTEQVFRYNARHGNDADRFLEVLSNAPGHRVTWKELTAKN